MKKEEIANIRKICDEFRRIADYIEKNSSNVSANGHYDFSGFEFSDEVMNYIRSDRYKEFSAQVCREMDKQYKMFEEAWKWIQNYSSDSKNYFNEKIQNLKNYYLVTMHADHFGHGQFIFDKDGIMLTQRHFLHGKFEMLDENSFLILSCDKMNGIDCVSHVGVGPSSLTNIATFYAEGFHCNYWKKVEVLEKEGIVSCIGDNDITILYDYVHQKFVDCKYDNTDNMSVNEEGNNVRKRKM